MSSRVGQVLKGRYRIQSVLGEGGMGTVYLAQDMLLDRPRAIKELYPDPLCDESRLQAARLQFQREAHALSQLRHRNLPHVSDYFSVDENDYLVMDYIAGESLADILARQKRPTEQLLYVWLAQILDALEYCHQNGVLHRDIKPANIILTPGGQVMLVDFSLVKFLNPHSPRTATIVRGLGTPEYTPLEQYDASAGHTDARSDIYALGATLYHLLTGRPPQPVSQRILNPQTQPAMHEINPKISPWMARFVGRAMAVRPENRYQSAAEMSRELEARVFKLRMDSAVQVRVSPTPATPRRGAQHTFQPRARPRKTRDRSKSDRDRMVPVVLPMVVPFTVLLVLSFAVALILATGSSTAAAVIIAPLLLGGLAYHRIFSRRKQGPPKF